MCCKLKKMEESHTAENLSNVLKMAIYDWGLIKKGIMPALTTDNAYNIVNAARLAGIEFHVKCFAHSLNLATQKSLKVSPLDQILPKIRKVVGFFHRSNIANQAFKQKQVLLEISQHKLIMDVSTRWNSTLDMIQRYLEQISAVEAVLLSCDLKKQCKNYETLDEEISLLERLVNVLEPVKTITEILCNENKPTLSLIHPMKETLLKNMGGLRTDCEVIKKMKQVITDDLESRYNDPEVVDFLVISSCLDPRFRSLQHMEDIKKHEVYALLMIKASSILKNQFSADENIQPSNESDVIIPLDDPIQADAYEVDTNVTTAANMESLEGQFESEPMPSTSSSPAEQPKSSSEDSIVMLPQKNNKKDSAIENLLGSVYSVKNNNLSMYENLQVEINKYRNETPIPLTADPLQWWKNNQHLFPLLSFCAKIYLSIQSTSVPSERIFSTAGDICSAQRFSLTSENVDMLIFLKKNLEI